MPNWITIAATDLNDHKVADLVTALREEALGAGQTDPMPGIIEEVTNELRGAIAFSGRYQLDADEATVPRSFREMVTKKIIRVMKGRLQQSLDEDEKTDGEVYESRLKGLGRGEWPVDKPDIADTDVPTQSTGATPRITARERSYRREDGDGS